MGGCQAGNRAQGRLLGLLGSPRYSPEDYDGYDENYDDNDDNNDDNDDENSDEEDNDEP